MARQNLPGQGLSTPAPLPGPLLLDRVLFESPLLLAGPLVIAAVVALFVSNARARLKQGALLALALLVLAAALFTTATLVTTPREAVSQRTRNLIDAVATPDITVASTLLSDDPRIRYEGFAAPSRDALLSLIARTMGPGGYAELQSWRVAELQATIDGPRVARSQVLVRATHKATALPASAWVRLHWELDAAGDWRCFAVEPLDIR